MNDQDKRRADKLRQDMEIAIREKDTAAFMAAYGKTLSHWYMPVKEQREFYMRMIKACAKERSER